MVPVYGAWPLYCPHVWSEQFSNGDFQCLTVAKVSREHEECDDAKRQTIMHILSLEITPMA